MGFGSHGLHRWYGCSGGWRLVEAPVIRSVTSEAWRCKLAVMKAILSTLALALLIGCAHGAPPSGVERALYNVTTNYVTNISNYVQIDTNRVVTNVVWVTNVSASYDLQPRASVDTGVQATGALATGLGFPLAIPILGLLAGLYAWWAEYRNLRKAKLNTVLSNNVQVGRETILATAGPQAESQFVMAIASAQVKAGVKELAVAVKDSKVDEKEAREEAASVVSLAKRASVSQTA